MNDTTIEWCARPGTLPKTWNPIRARLVKDGRPRTGTMANGKQIRSGTFCTRISPGCTHCYASTINQRFGNGLEYTVPNLEKVEFFVSEKILQEPLKTKKPCTIFVADMFDLFHEAIPLEMIEEVLLVIAQAKQHTFQLLTKRAERMQKIISTIMYRPHPHVWFGVSVEDQQRADERIPFLLRTPAEIRFLSVEPQLQAVNLTPYFRCNCGVDPKNDQFAPPWSHSEFCPYRARIHQVICGGESGPKARPFDLTWAESLREQCKASGVSFFFKQAGSFPMMPRNVWEDRHNPLNLPPGITRKDPLLLSAHNDPKIAALDGGALCAIGLKDRKGGAMEEWPENLRVREFPA